MFSWNFAVFLTLVATLVIAAPFTGRRDWLGWAASLVTVAAALAIFSAYVSTLVRTVKEWWNGEFD